MNLKIAFVVAFVALAFTQVNAQTSGQGTGPVRSVEERVADEFKEKRLRKAAEETMAAEESNRIAKLNPEALLSRARTIYINSDTKFFEEVQLQSALRRRPEFKEFDLAVLDGWANSKTADLWIEIDRPLFTYTFTYEIMDRSTNMVVASGSVIAFDGNLAAPKLASRIIEDIKKARGVAIK